MSYAIVYHLATALGLAIFFVLVIVIYDFLRDKKERK